MRTAFPVLILGALASAGSDPCRAQASKPRAVPAPARASQKAKPAATNEDVRAFLARVAQKIRSKEAPQSLRSFRARVSTPVRGPDGATAKMEVGIDYLFPVYLLTRVKQGKETWERGRNRSLVPWMRKGSAKAYDLEGKEYAVDRANVNRHLAIAAGMTRFLYPDRVLGGLTGLQGPTAEDIPWRRAERIRALRVDGIAEDGSDFPLASAPAYSGPLRIRAWFQPETLSLLAIRLEPLRSMSERMRVGRFEELQFLRHVKKQGLLLPKKIMLFIEDPQKKRTQLAQSFELISFRANPLSLTKASFKRPH